MTRATMSRMRRVVVPILAVGCVVALALVVAPNGRRERPTLHRDDAPFGAYAGYLWLGKVSTVQGAWNVPAIVTGSRPGFATTWIGVRGSTKLGAFIQVGTAELRGDSREHVAESRYWAFWSDTAHHFHPVFLFVVRPADQVKTSLARSRTGWLVTITDETSDHEAHFVMPEEGSAPFSSAQWTQENPLDSTGSRYPYPSLSGVAIRGIAVNGAPPPISSVYSSWMSVNHVNLRPTQLAHDAFKLRAAEPSLNGDLYLRISARWVSAAHAFAATLDRRQPPPSGADLFAATRQFRASLRQGIRSLSVAQLPSSTHGPISSVIGTLRSLDALTHAPYTESVMGLSAWRWSFARAWSGLREREHPVRRALGIPEFTPTSRP